jgi:mono/diheme cytochrome c family protein
LRRAFTPSSLLAAIALGLVVTSAPAAEESAAQAPAADSGAQPAAAPFDVKNTFRNICGFCHQDYGRKAGKGPQLMHSERSDEQLFKTIKNGKPPQMAAFGSVFTDAQIHDIVRFIRNLKPDQAP